MKISKIIAFFVGTIIVAVFTNTASATLTELLPYSSHYQGKSYFDTDGYAGHIDFAVYDTSQYPDEFIGAGHYDNPGDGQYIYAYQIFCDSVSQAIDYFTILGIGEEAIGDMTDIGTADDGSGGVDAIEYDFNPSMTEAYWVFGNVTLISNGHSFFLVYSSDHDWTVGNYSFSASGTNELPVANPEPCTIALLAGGASLMLIKKKRKRT